MFDYNHVCEGDNFFKSASYTIEAICADSHLEAAVKLKDVEAQILSKRNEVHQFETEYHEVWRSNLSTPFMVFSLTCVVVSHTLVWGVC